MSTSHAASMILWSLFFCGLSFGFWKKSIWAGLFMSGFLWFLFLACLCNSPRNYRETYLEGLIERRILIERRVSLKLGENLEI